MANTVRKIALQITIPVLCVLIALNAYLVTKNVKRIQENAEHRVEASEMQAGVANVLFDLQDMETGQRGYLLTGDPSYLQPYTEANGRLAAHFANLRSRLTRKSPQERALETQLEALAESKIEEMKETIRLRELGYRHRAFQTVSSNTGKELMDKARTTLHALSSAQTSNVARYDRELDESVRRAIKESALASFILFVVSVVTFFAFNTYRRRLERACSQHTEDLRAASLQLDRFTSTISHDFRALVGQVRAYANTLLDLYGGFLPRQGQEQAERIENGVGQMNRLLDELFTDSPSANFVKVIDIRTSEKLSA